MESNYVNLIPEREATVFNASQYDNGRVKRLNLYDGGIAHKLTGAEVVRVRYKKPNGDVGSIGVTNTSSTYVDITIPAEMTDISGRVYCKLRIDGIGAKAFYLNVEGR